MKTIYKQQRIQKFEETGDTRCICQNELDNVCFQHDMAYGVHKHLPRRTTFDKRMRYREFAIDSNPQYYGYQSGITSVVYKCYDKKSRTNTAHTVTVNISENQYLANELHRIITRKFMTRGIYLCFGDIVWGADVADMQLISRYNKGDSYYVILIFTGNILGLLCSWVVLLKNKKMY